MTQCVLSSVKEGNCRNACSCCCDNHYKNPDLHQNDLEYMIIVWCLLRVSFRSWSKLGPLMSRAAHDLQLLPIVVKNMLCTLRWCSAFVASQAENCRIKR
jgi:hypothetical protein